MLFVGLPGIPTSVVFTDSFLIDTTARFDLSLTCYRIVVVNISQVCRLKVCCCCHFENLAIFCLPRGFFYDGGM